LIEYLEQNFDSKFNKSDNGFDKFKTIIDYVFNCLENNDGKFFPADRLESLSFNLNDKPPQYGNYLNQKISQNKPLQKRPKQLMNINHQYSI